MTHSTDGLGVLGLGKLMSEMRPGGYCMWAVVISNAGKGFWNEIKTIVTDMKW